jgi:hypothetical protein
LNLRRSYQIPVNRGGAIPLEPAPSNELSGIFSGARE